MAIAVTVKDKGALTRLKARNARKEIKKKGWATQYGYLDFDRPVTLAEANAQGAELQNRLDDIAKEQNNVGER